MLAPGHKIFDAQVVSLLSEDKLCQRYLVRCADQREAVLLHCQGLPQDHQSHVLTTAQNLVDRFWSGLGLPEQVGLDDGVVNMLLPKVSGQSLAEISREKPLTQRQAIDLLAQVGRLLVTPHANDLAHANLSPQTVHVDNGRVGLSEFHLGSLLKLDFNSGLDPAYTSPEQVRGGQPGPAADIYNLGCLLYFLLTGQQAMQAAEPFAVAMQHLQGDFPRLDEQHSCFGILQQMTAANAADRPSIQIVLEAFEEQLNGDDSAGDVVAPVDGADDPAVSVDKAIFETESDDAGLDGELTARIEARLRENNFIIYPPRDDKAQSRVQKKSRNEASDEEHKEQVSGTRRGSAGRYLMLLLMGLLIGSGGYFFFFSGRDNTLSRPVVETVAQDRQLEEQMDRALNLWRGGDLDQAVVIFKQLAVDYSSDPRPLNNLAAIYAEKGDYEQARLMLEQALNSDSRYATVYKNLSAVYAEMARDSYGRALQLDQSDRRLHLTALSSQGIVGIVSADLQGEVDAPVVDETLLAAAASEDVVDKIIAETPPAASPAENDSEPAAKAAVEALASASSPEQEVAQVKPSRPEPVVVEDVADETFQSMDQGEAQDFLRAWAKAWSSQNVSAYLTYYDDSFVPPGGKSRQQWESERYQRLTRPKKIEVELSDFSVVWRTENGARIDALQQYSNERFSDRTRKRFDLNLIDGQWSITRERSLGSVQ